MASTVSGVLLTGVHGSRPSSGVTAGTLYACSTHSLIYQTSDTGSTWATWATLAGTGLTDPMTTRGDIIVRDSSNVTARKAVGAAGKILSSDGTDVSWGNGPMTTAGDIIIGGASGLPTRLAAGATSGHVLTSNGSGAAPSYQAAGGGGSDLVQTYSGAGSVYIPGLRGSADVKPASPSSFDDEFEALSGWTTLGTLDTSNVSDVPSNWHVARTLAAIGVDGIYKTAPSMPFTVTAKLSGGNVQYGANYNMIGILLTESAPGKLCTFGLVSNASTQTASLYRWTNRSTFSTNVDVSTARGTGTPLWRYIRLVVTSSSSVTGYLSDDGLYWVLAGVTAQTTSLTVANVGLCIGDAAASGSVEAYFDWIRFT